MATIHQIQQFTSQKHLAIVGISRTPHKFANSAFKELQKKGYQLYPVSLHLDQYEGSSCYKDIASLPSEVTAVLICTKSDQTGKLLNEARQKGIKNIWLQQGSADKALLDSIKQTDDNVITKHCILMFAEPSHFIHRTHAFMKKLFRTYPN